MLSSSSGNLTANLKDLQALPKTLSARPGRGHVLPHNPHVRLCSPWWMLSLAFNSSGHYRAGLPHLWSLDGSMCCRIAHACVPWLLHLVLLLAYICSPGWEIFSISGPAYCAWIAELAVARPGT